MILKKPYALLIKYFKLIHLLLSFCIGLITFNLYNLYTFFSNLSKYNYTNINNAEILSYFPTPLYFAIIIAIVLSSIIFLLMKFKNKPRIYYIFIVLLNIIILFYLNYSKNYMKIILTETSNPVTNGILRDVSLFSWIISLCSIFFSILRSIGFDIKKFNFKKDIADLKIEELDNEEIELNINIKKYDMQRTLNKKRINIKKFFKAKKKIFIFIFAIFLIYGAYIITINVFFYNKIYYENQIVKTEMYSYKINKSIYTNINSTGEVISNNRKYLVINLTIYTNLSNLKFSTTSISIESKNKNYFPIFNAYNFFSDLGNGYKNQILKNENNYILVFKMDDNIDIDNVVLKHYDRTLNNGKRLYKKIKLAPIGGNNKNNVINKKLSETLNIDDNSINIKSFDIKKSFEYEYNYCVSYIECIKSKDVLSEKEDLILKLHLDDFNSVSKIIDYAYITYDTLFDKNIIINLNSITPKNTINELYFKVPNELKSAKHIYFNFLTREKKYVYILK